MNRDFVTALLQLNAEKQVPRDQLIRTVEDAIQSAYRRQPGDEDVCVRIDGETGRIRVFRAKVAVGEVTDPLTEFGLDDAQVYNPAAVLGDLVEIEEMDPNSFGRIHAQTAKQVVLQRLREAERDVAFDQFASRDGELITGTVNRIEPRAIILELVGQGGIARAEAILATTEQSPLEHYRIGQNVKALVLEVRRGLRGPQLFISRSHKNFLRRLFELEVPEIHNGTVEIKAIAREAGSRSKVAVWSRQDGLDPVGATVGQRGARVQAVVAELAGEKIDVIPWNDDPAVFVANALSPAQVLGVQIDDEHRIASVTVPERMLSLAIGREGQNARLAAKLTGWRIDIRSDVSVAEAAKVAEDAAIQAAADALAADALAAESAATEAAAVVKPAPKPRARKAVAEPLAATEAALAVKPVAKPRATKAAVKPVAKPRATKAAVKPVAKPRATKAAVKPVAKPRATKAAVKPVAKPRAKKTTGEVAS
jgi:N utilization substance protein A